MYTSEPAHLISFGLGAYRQSESGSGSASQRPKRRIPDLDPDPTLDMGRDWTFRALFSLHLFS